ncbi:uncharacterized protein GIQ15_06497 [Arthroderma uncinatum]|uniref:uncharacterized protein n=1 Tax=Arthroderma uncinatum TaxID=74035 RepID=UPI00144ABA23|nr:uncharacterized protein GIQ15_06497 [Arthroderma uncinatum]KAF3479521.1 hypothetical protein GIQ15_06497 [Arthroderma uncinatum]
MMLGNTTKQPSPSSRSRVKIPSKMPLIPTSTDACNGYFRPGTIDLSRTENFLLREELAEICKSVKTQDIVSQHPFSSSDDAGDPRLLESLARLFNNYFNPCIPVSRSHIATAPGAAGCLDALLYNISSPGDGVLIPGPHWGDSDLDMNFSHTGVKPVTVNTNMCGTSHHFLKALNEAIDNAPCRIKALVIRNMSSSFGECYPQEFLEVALKFCQHRRIHFISDEVYALTAFSCAEISDPVPFVSALALDSRAVGCDLSRIHTIWSISTDFGATGFKVGCTVSQGNKELVRGLSNAPNAKITPVSHAFATSLLSSPRLPILIALNSAGLAECYMLITSFFVRHGIKYIPVNAGLSIFARLAPNARSRDDEAEMVQVLKNAGVMVSNAGGSFHKTFKEKGWARISFSVEPNQLHEALGRIELALGLGLR